VIICTFTPTLLTEIEMIEINQIRTWNEGWGRPKEKSQSFIIIGFAKSLFMDCQFCKIRYLDDQEVVISWTTNSILEHSVED
jgi:hypothetical protein